LGQSGWSISMTAVHLFERKTKGYIYARSRVGVFIREKVRLEPNLFPYKYSNILKPVIFHTYPPMKMEQSVPKRRHIKLRRRGITQKKAHNNI
jgi:hypothetical protein